MAEFIKVDALGDACPLPVVKAKKAISELQGAGQVEVLVDNEIAVQNLTKMAQQKGYQYSAEKLEERKYRVLFTLGEVVSAPAEDAPVCTSDARTDTVVAISAAVMGEGSEELGKILLKAFVFALTQQDKLPKTILFYNGGAALTCEGSAMLEDLKALEAQKTEAENLEIVQMVRALRMTPTQLSAMLSGGTVPGSLADDNNEQEENSYEE